jgi:tape measure domain-containing protein
MRDYGFATGDILKLTEALVIGTQLSGAGATEASLAMGQFSRALARGVLSGENFKAMGADGARVLSALAAGLGITSAELKILADDGLLTVDKVLPALLSQLGVLQQEFAAMPNSISGSMNGLSNAFQKWVGDVDGATGTTQLLSRVIGSAADNMNLLASAAAGLGVGYATLKSAEMVKTLYVQIAAVRTAHAAEMARTRAQLDASTMAARHAAAELAAAQAHAQATRSTDLHTAALSRLRLARLADIQATRVHAAAQAASAAAGSRAARAGAGLLSVLGGPVGLAVTLGTVAAGYLLFSDNSDKARQSLIDLKRPVSELREEFAKLSKAQVRYMLDGVLEQKAQAEADVERAIRGIRSAATTSNELGDFDSGIPTHRQTALVEFDRRLARGDGIDSASQQLGLDIGASRQQAQTINKGAADYADAMDAKKVLGNREKLLQERLNESEGLPRKPKPGAVNQPSAGPQATQEHSRQVVQLNNAYSQTLSSLSQQIALHGETTELGRVRQQLSHGELAGLSEQNKVILERAALELDALNSRKAYDGLMASMQTQEQRLLATTRDRLQVLEAANDAGKLSGDEYRAGAEAISQSTVTEAPTFSGTASQVSGPMGELIKSVEAEAELKAWHEKQLGMQAELYAEKLTGEQEYLDRVFEINKTNQQRLNDIQGAYKAAMLGTFSELSGNAADMVGKMAGEQSGAYKVLFLAQKAFAVASIIMNTQIAAAKAPAELMFVAGIPMSAAILAAGYANAGMVAGMTLAGMAHDGIDSIPREGTWLLQKGERVVDGRTNQDLKQFLSNTPDAANQSQSAPQINITINGDGSGGTVESAQDYEAMGQALLVTVRAEMPKVARGVIINEKGQNGLLDPNNRRAG